MQQTTQDPIQLQPRKHLILMASDPKGNRVAPLLTMRFIKPRQRRNGVVRVRGHGFRDMCVGAADEGFEEGGREPAFADVGDSEEDVRAGYGDYDGGGGGSVWGGDREG